MIRGVEALVRDWRAAGLSARERAICAYAAKLTLDPHSMVQADVQALRDIGLDDRGILDVCQVTAYYNFVNRMADGLGVELEEYHPR